MKNQDSAMREFEISLENLRFFGRHGVFEHETRDGNEFEVNLYVRFNLENKTQKDIEDSLSQTISYVSLYEIVKHEMNRPRKLLETLAIKIAETVIEKFEICKEVNCKIVKLNPPISGIIGRASVNYRILK